MNKKIIWTIVGVIVLIIVVVAVNNKKSADSTVRIGAIFPLTGGLAIYGEPAQKAAQLAMDDINASGGLNGKNLEISFEDHKCDPKTAVSAFQKLSSQGVKIFTSVACSGTVLGIAPELANYKALLMGTTVTTPKITGVSPFVFRNWASDIQESKLFADEIRAKGYKKVGMIYEVTDYAKGVALNMQEALKDTLVMIDAESFATGATDARTQLTKIQAFKPDVILVSVQTVNSGEMILTQMEQLGIKAKLFVTDNIVASAKTLIAHKALLEGAVGAEYILQSPEKAAKVLAEYKARYGEDCPQPTVCAGVYDAISMLSSAIKETSYSADAVRKYLGSVSFDGSSGLISFDSNNDRNGATYTLFVVKNGSAEQVAR